MAVIRPITTFRIHADLRGVISLLQVPIRQGLGRAIFWSGFLGLMLGLEIWARTQPDAAVAEISPVLRHAYAHLFVGALFVALAARPLKGAWTFPARFQRDLTLLGLMFCGLHASWFGPALQTTTIDVPGETGLLLGVIALGGLLPLVASPSGMNSRKTAWRLIGAFALFVALHALIAVGNASEQSGIGLSVAAFALLVARLGWPTVYSIRLETADAPSKWTGNAIYARENRKERVKDTHVPADHPTPVDAEPTPSEASRSEIKVVKRMRFEGSSFQPVFDADLRSDEPNNEFETPTNTYQRQRHGTLLESMIGHFDVLDELERYATDANKLSVLYRRTENERVIRCSLAVNFDPLEDGWMALEVANQILVIVQRSVSHRLKLGKLEVRVYQERFRQGEQRRFERTFSFDLANLNPPPLGSPDQIQP
jgi:hypothetical protein